MISSNNACPFVRLLSLKRLAKEREKTKEKKKVCASCKAFLFSQPLQVSRLVNPSSL